MSNDMESAVILDLIGQDLDSIRPNSDSVKDRQITPNEDTMEQKPINSENIGDEIKSEQNKNTDKAELPFKTCPFDPRFPQTNQTNHCFISFVDYQRCSRLLGNYEGCDQLKSCYRSLCPNQWVQKWEEQIEAGTFPVNLPSKNNRPERYDSIMDGQERLLCPFDKAHYILKSRMQKHITQCKKNYPLSNLKVCPFNQIHYLPPQELEYHIEHCPNRRELERNIFQVGPAPVSIDSLIVKDVPSCGEDWDAEDNVSYLDKRDEILKSKKIFLQGEMNIGKAARRNFRMNEKVRHQELEIPRRCQEFNQDS